jgi:hypothetical protein
VLTRAPAFAPQQWHHAVRLVNGQDLSWGFTGVTSPPFGTGKTSFVTPNPMYVQGNFNTALKTVIRNGASTPDQSVPCAIMADEITILSNSWTDDPWKRPGMSFVPGTLAYPSAPMTASQTWGTLAINAAGSWVSAPVATSTTVAAAIVVNNQPTTKSTAIIGESAAIASIVNLVENWYAKPFGPTPFGHLDRTSGLDWANNDEVKTHSGWWNAYGNRPTNVAGNRWTAPSSGSNTMPSVYGNARRTLIFNPDLLTPEGTPPYAPFGVSVNGIGGWVRSQ